MPGNHILNSFGLTVQGAPVQGFEVALSNRNCRVFVRLAVCAALLANALFGRTLHLSQHAAEAAWQRHVACGEQAGCRRDSRDEHGHDKLRHKTACAAKQASHAACAHSHAPCSDDVPRDSHDHHDCAICYAIGQCATSPESVTIYRKPETVVERAAPGSESAETALEWHFEARGPPVDVRA